MGIILDTGSTFSIFKDVQDIKQAKDAMLMQTNAGTRVCSEEAAVPGLGTVNNNRSTNNQPVVFVRVVDVVAVVLVVDCCCCCFYVEASVTRLLPL